MVAFLAWNPAHWAIANMKYQWFFGFCIFFLVHSLPIVFKVMFKSSTLGTQK